jgi:hypothetical protein
MTVARQLASRRALQQLQAQPLLFLQATPFTAGQLGGNDTIATQLSFAIDNNAARMGPQAFLAATHPVGTHIHQVDAYATPMRNAVVGAARTAPTARFAPGAGPGLWVTTRQTGCSVLVVDWGAALSMVHLQPFPPGAFRWPLRKLMGVSNYALRETRRYSLQAEMSTVVANSRVGGQDPLRYILVQSNWAQNYLGVTGVRNAVGVWEFFLQEYTAANAVVNAVQLNWTPWRHWGRLFAGITYNASAY